MLPEWIKTGWKIKSVQQDFQVWCEQSKLDHTRTHNKAIGYTHDYGEGEQMNQTWLQCIVLKKKTETSTDITPWLNLHLKMERAVQKKVDDDFRRKNMIRN